jgi:competence protein ComFB
MEDLVMHKLDMVINANPAVCRCKLCRCDIVALALNFLPTRYVATSTGEMYSKLNTLDQQIDVDIVTAITQAILIVLSNPHHEEK